MEYNEKGGFRFTRLTERRKERFNQLDELLKTENDVASETWLFVGAHDDDICIGAGLWLQAAVQAGVRVEAIIVSDGRMGYCSAEQEPNIIEIRRQETIDSFAVLGVPAAQVTFWNYPDNDLFVHQGRRKAKAGELAIAGYSGLQNTFTHYLRKFQPQRIIVPADSDLHPDHKIVYTELLISVFHAEGAIWPELGDPLPQLPTIYESAIYDNFYELPNLEVHAPQEAFVQKIRSIEAYQSQAQIEQVVAELHEDGPYEYFRERPFMRYLPANYRHYFR